MMVPVGMGPGGIAWAGADDPLEKDFAFTCKSQTHRESYTIEFPGNVVIDGIPKGTSFRDESVNYSSTYSVKGRVVKVKRRLAIQYKESVCGIPSSPALINLGAAYKLAKVGVIQPLNHVITYVPSLDLYLDSTDQFSPFGLLIFEDMDKPTVLTALGKIGRTPRMLASENVGQVDLKMKIDRDGVVHGTSSVNYQGVPEIESRRLS